MGEPPCSKLSFREDAVPDSRAQYAMLLDLRDRVRVLEANVSIQSDEIRTIALTQSDQIAADQQGEDSVSAVRLVLAQLVRRQPWCRLIWVLLNTLGVHQKV